MKADSPSDVTALLRAWSAGDLSAQETLWPIVFDELKRLAHRQLRRERPADTLQTGALVNEAYLRLVDWKVNHGRAVQEGRDGGRPGAYTNTPLAETCHCAIPLRRPLDVNAVRITPSSTGTGALVTRRLRMSNATARRFPS